jgi:hypothetical protein
LLIYDELRSFDIYRSQERNLRTLTEMSATGGSDDAGRPAPESNSDDSHHPTVNDTVDEVKRLPDLPGDQLTSTNKVF